MTNLDVSDFSAIREVMADFKPSPKVSPNDTVEPDNVFTPESHRAVLDLSRQLVVGNRGMGKSFWTHALTEPEVRKRAADAYAQPTLNKTEVVIGFNGSDKPSEIAPTIKSIARALGRKFTPDDIWQAIIFRAVQKFFQKPEGINLDSTLEKLKSSPNLFEETLFNADNELHKTGRNTLIIFDALDRLAENWHEIQILTASLMKLSLGLKSFRAIRTKIFIRPDQYSDPGIFQFPDASKLKNEHVDLSWQPYELFGLLLFEIQKSDAAKSQLSSIAEKLNAGAALRPSAQRNRPAHEEQRALINAIAGTYMGSDARRGRVYTWVPLHLSDAKNTCSPRTFLTAWRKAAEHAPAPRDRAVDHLGLIEGVRQASTTRLDELREDYRWIDSALEALRGQFVPMERTDLLKIWRDANVAQQIVDAAAKENWLAPVELEAGTDGSRIILDAMKSIAVMEERANGKINVPDIFRVEAGIKRKGGVAVPRRG